MFFQVSNSEFTVAYIGWPNLCKNGLKKDWNEKHQWLSMGATIMGNPFISFLYH